jgi:Domain of unknown function DUF29
MNRLSRYDDDILEWSEQQAAALRHVARTPGISNEIDWDNVAEEIECVGRSEFAAVLSFVRLILVHVIKAVSVPEASSLLHWRKEVVAFHSDLLDRVSPSMRSRIDIDKLWQRAIKQAEADLADQGHAVMPDLPRQCPLALAEIVAPEFDFIEAVAAVRRQFEKDRPSE